MRQWWFYHWWKSEFKQERIVDEHVDSTRENEKNMVCSQQYDAGVCLIMGIPPMKIMKLQF